jgi:hypothetical protein
MKTLILLLLFSATTFAQSYVELRGGSNISEFGGQIGIGYSYEINRVSIYGMYNAFSLDNASFDRYDLEAGYSFGNYLLKATPIIGYGYTNNRSWRVEDKLSLTYGMSISLDFKEFIFTSGYRDNQDINYLFVGVKIRFVLSKKKKHRFF